MQTNALDFDYSREENISQPIRTRKRVKVRVKSKKRYSNNGRKQPLKNLTVRNWVLLAAQILLLFALVAGLFYVAYHYFPESEVYPEYKPVTTTATSSLE